jgi:hypothetical protein
MSSIQYVQGSDLADLTIAWYDAKQQLIDFNAGYSYQVKVGYQGQSALITKTAGITGATTDPNLTIAWSVSDGFASLAPGFYILQVTATRNADGRKRSMQHSLEIVAGVL